MPGPKPLGAAARRAIERARRARPLALLRRAAKKEGVPVWLVGGAVRDLLLGRGHPDLDVVVPRGAAELLARDLHAFGLGTIVPLSEESPRVVRVAGRDTLDLAELEGDTLAQDLARRDFTANAMAFELSSGSLEDPFGGAADLARRRLRLVRAGNLEEDPLRVLRAARFLATHGLGPDAALTAACRRAAPGLARAAPERIALELSKLLEAPRAAPALGWAARAGVLSEALGRPVAPTFTRRLGRLDTASISRLPPPRRRTVRLALLADLLELSANEAAAWLSGLRFSREEGRRAARLLELARAAASGLPAEDWRWVVAARDDGKDALRIASGISKRGAAISRRLSRKLARPRPRVRVSGGDLLAWTGLSPGPRIGALLGDLEVEIRRGAIKTRKQARDWSRATAQTPDASKSHSANEMKTG